MSKTQKVILIVGTILLVGGLTLSLGAFAAAGFDIRNLSTTGDWNQSSAAFTIDEENPIDEIIVKEASENVRFEATDSDEIEVIFWENENKHYAVSETNGVLSVEANYRVVFSFMSIDFDDHATVIKVPRDYIGAIQAEVASGNVSVAKLTELTSAKLSTASGTIGATGIEADRISAHSTSGAINLIDVIATDVSLDVSSGNVVMEGVTTSTLEASLISGNINASRCEADVVIFNTASGDIKAQMIGSEDQYIIASSSLSGSVTAPLGATSSDKSISLRATSGNVNLTFSESSTAQSADKVESSDRSEGSAPAAPEAPAAPAAPAAPEAPAAPAAPEAPNSLSSFAPTDHVSLSSSIFELLSRLF